jgi:hypothetical protein
MRVGSGHEISPARAPAGSVQVKLGGYPESPGLRQ